MQDFDSFRVVSSTFSLVLKKNLHRLPGRDETASIDLLRPDAMGPTTVPSGLRNTARFTQSRLSTRDSGTYKS